VDKVAALATVEKQLQQERSARQQAEARLQQERSALEEARVTLERERMAREEAQHGTGGGARPTPAGALHAGGSVGYPQALGSGDHVALGRAGPIGCVLRGAAAGHRGERRLHS
jgi:hypothetical protein